MRKAFLFTLLLAGCASITTLQKAKFITVTNLLDAGKFVEAKEVVDELTANIQSARLARTWYLRGLLCQTAYQEGLKKSDKNLMELYPNQLSEAFISFQKAERMDRGRKMELQIASRYSILANQLQNFGETCFAEKRYKAASTSFEQAMVILNNKAISAQPDLNLQFNAGLAAYEGKEWERAIGFFLPLHKKGTSTNTTHLLQSAYLQMADTTSALKVLVEGVEQHEYPENLVLLLSDLQFQQGRFDELLKLLQTAIEKSPNSIALQYTLGLTHQKQEQYAEAITAYNKVQQLEPNHLQVLVNLATCHYNQGVETYEQARQARSIGEATSEREKANIAFGDARQWLVRAQQIESSDAKILLTIDALDRNLRLAEKNR